MSSEPHRLDTCVCTLCHSWRRVGTILRRLPNSSRAREIATRRVRDLYLDLLDEEEGVGGPPLAGGEVSETPAEENKTPGVEGESGEKKTPEEETGHPKEKADKEKTKDKEGVAEAPDKEKKEKKGRRRKEKKDKKDKGSEVHSPHSRREGEPKTKEEVRARSEASGTTRHSTEAPGSSKKARPVSPVRTLGGEELRRKRGSRGTRY